MAQDKLKISVAMTTYNGEKFVREQLESIVNQTRPPDEIIICDDISGDKTVEIIKSIKNELNAPIILCVNEQNLGVDINFEKSISLTSGDVIFISDQDDVWYNNKIEFIENIFVKNSSLLMVHHNADVVDSKLASKNYSIYDVQKTLHLGSKRNIKEVVDNVRVGGGKMAITSELKRLALPFPPQPSNIWPYDHWIASIAYATGRVKSISLPLMYYRRHETNLSKEPNISKVGWNLFKEAKSIKNNKEVLISLLKKRRLLDERLNYIVLQNRCDLDDDKLRKCIEKNKEYIESYLLRLNLIDMTYFLRLIASINLLKQGFYHKYFKGYMSFARDLFNFK